MWGVAVINNPRFREIALEIVSAPDFNGSDEGLGWALKAWRKALTSEQWRKAADALICGYLMDVRAEYEQNLPAVARRPMPDPQPPVRGEIRFVEAVVEPGPVDEPADPPAAGPPVVLRHSTESENWSGSGVPDEITGPERLPSPPTRRMPPPSSPEFGPVVVSHVADRAPEPAAQGPVAAEPSEPAPKPVHIQQPGWKVPAARNKKMFPSLGSNRRMVNGVMKTEGQATHEDILALNYQDEQQIRVYLDRITHRKATIARRDDLTRRDTAQNRVEDALARELRVLVDRRAAADARLVQLPKGTMIEQLDAEVLVECGYERRSA